jgi:hypothetical protein
VGPVLLTSNDDAKKQTANAPIQVQAGGTFINVDPKAAIDGLQNRLQGKP